MDRKKEGTTVFKCSEILEEFCRISFVHFYQLFIDINGHLVVVPKAGSLLVEGTDPELALEKKRKTSHTSMVQF